ncbi:MAG: stage II sporulation protein P [Eubacteriales bacterium]|nr:stage II sporulation protein P [Eubacteriales bacterium]
MWEIRKRQAVKAFSRLCTCIVLCVSVMIVSALFVKLLPKSMAKAIYGKLSSSVSSETESIETSEGEKLANPEEITIIDSTWGSVIIKDDTSYEGDAVFVSSVNLARYTKSQNPSIFVINQTNYTINTDKCIAAAVSAGCIYAEGPTVLIYHTHGTESYIEGDTYETGESFRSEDITENVVAVGEAFAEELRSHGINVIHDTEMYDKESYSESYTNSKKAVKAWLHMYPSICYVIDIHRDSVMMSEKQVKLISEINGENVAQVMIVVGTDESGSSHSGWLDNFTAAVHLQSKINELYPTLARPIYLRTASFNQELSAGALLIEIGSCGNTLEEALSCARLTAKAMAEAFK